MEVNFTQMYIEPGIDFDFSYHFQEYLSEEVSALVSPSPKFLEKYGRNYSLSFCVSAKKRLKGSELRGPSLFKKMKSVEYTIFLPFSVIRRESEIPQTALRFLLKGVCSVFESLDIDTTKIVERQGSMIEHICSDPKMFEEDSWE